MTEETNFSPPWSDDEYLITQGKPYLMYDDAEQKYKIAMMENVFIYEKGGAVLKSSFEQEIITDEDPTEKVIFKYKLTGDTKLDSLTDLTDN